jgi:subfamily B ATP-binding cassette protein HlyB/CyaB
MQSALIALEVCGQLNKVAIDSKNIAKEYALNEAEPSIEELTRIAKHLDFKAGLKQIGIEKAVQNYPLPLIAQKKEGSYFTVIKADIEKKELLVFDTTQKEPYLMSFDEYKEVSSKKIIILKHKMFSQQIKFGFGWFYNQMLKYKLIIGEVLAASFILQLFGLVTPLFTQVILDKVLVHHAISTLNVLAVAFLVVTVFDFIINLARNYMFNHTTSKIDA